MLSTIALAMMLAGVAHAGESTMDGGRFGAVTLYVPQTQPTSVALFISGDGGWNRGVIDMARVLTDMRAIVVGVDIRRYLRSLEESSTSCTSLAVDFENLSHEVQKGLHLQTYHVPILVGYSSGATLVYATLAQAPAGIFGGALSMGFCPDLQLATPLCRGAGLSYTTSGKGKYVFDAARQLTQPWVAFQGQRDLVCDAKAVDEFAGRIPAAEVVKLPLVGHGFSVERNWLEQFRSTYHKLAAGADPIGAARADPNSAVSVPVDDLPLSEVTVARQGDTMALLLTGDGGWAGLDRQLAAKLASKGVPVVGLSSLSYFWHEKSPEQTSKDVARLLHHYLGEWGRSRVLLVGYSFGADVLPFVVNRLPDDLRARVESVSLLGLGTHATFEVHTPSWLGGRSQPGIAVSPELQRLPHVPVLCVYGDGETDSLCPGLSAAAVTIAKIGSGHHFSNDADALVDRILAIARGAGASVASHPT